MFKSRFQISDLAAGGSHNLLLVGLTIFNLLLFIVMVFINLASSNVSWGIFSNSTSDISKYNEVDITPAGWTFATWGIIYTWQGLWLFYNVFLFFKRSEYGRLYMAPPILTLTFHLFITANFALNIAWLFLWDRQLFWVAFPVLCLIAATLYSAAVVSHYKLVDGEQYLERSKRSYIWLYRILVNNGLAFYATWVTIASALNFAIALTSNAGVDRSTSSLVALSGVTLILIAYFILEITIYEKYLRWTFSPYIQLLIAFSGVLAKNFPNRVPASYFTLVLIILGPGVFLLAKTAMTVYKSTRRR